MHHTILSFFHRPVVFLLSAMVLSSFPLRGQQFSVSTNIAEWANLGTMNADAGMSVSRHFSVHVGVRINPWTFGTSDPEDSYKQITDENKKMFSQGKECVSLSVRYWPWYVFSGWWLRAKAQFSNYDRGGLFRPERHQGWGAGLGLGVGYSWMFNDRWNLEFGVAGWGGWCSERTWPKMNSQDKVEPVGRWFILPDEVVIGVSYVF